MQKVLVFSPHPDDDVIGCGGSILKHVQKGNFVNAIYMTSGEIGSLLYDPKKLATIRETEASKTAEFLGISETHFLRNPDGYLSYTKENLIRIVSLIREFQPNIVYTPHQYDEHRDHRITYDLVVEACLQASRPMVKECSLQLWSVNTILAYEISTLLQEVNYVEDITTVIDAKIKAMQIHESQIINFKYDEAIRNLNRLRGITTGKGAYCECFRVLKAENLFDSM